MQTIMKVPKAEVQRKIEEEKAPRQPSKASVLRPSPK
jgi:hypothetical protein